MNGQHDDCRSLNLYGIFVSNSFSGNSSLQPLEIHPPTLSKNLPWRRHWMIVCHHISYNHLTTQSALVVQDKLLEEENYAAWAKAMRLCLVSGWKLCFNNGKIPNPTDKTSEKYEASTVIGLVFSWIINIVDKHIASTIVYTNNAVIVWTNLEELYTSLNRTTLFYTRSVMNWINCTTILILFASILTS